MQNNKLRLLITDDDINGEILKSRLVKRGFDCVLVSSGQECIDALHNDKFDSVLMDIVMPEVTGLETLVEIRKKWNSVELPVIMATSKDETKDIVEALKSGANDYLTKPINIDIAEARIRTQTQLKELSQKLIDNQKLHVINTMMTTLNHEINNPLAIALGTLSQNPQSFDEAKRQRTVDALQRIAEIVRKVDKLSDDSLQEVAYSEFSSMYKIPR